MGKPSRAEQDRLGMAAIQDLHTTAMGSSRVARHLRGMSGEDTRIRSILADIDSSDPCVVDAWAMFVRAVLVGRTQRRDDERRSRRATAHGSDDRSLRQQFMEQGFDYEFRSSRSRLPTASTSGLRYSAPVRSRAYQSGRTAAETYTRPTRPTRENRYDQAADDWEFLNSMSPYEVFAPLSPNRRGHVGWDWPESPDLNVTELPDATAPGANEGLVVIEDTAGAGADDARPAATDAAASEAPTEPPTTLDRASPVPAATTRSASSSPDPASRAWLEEYERLFPSSSTASSSTIFTLGRRRRDRDARDGDDAGPSSASRRRLRHTDSSGRDTRRDAIILSPGPEGWLDNMILRERGWLTGPNILGTVGGDDAAEGDTVRGAEEEVAEGDDTTADGPASTSAPEAPPLVRTTSLTAVGGAGSSSSDRPVAPLPRRRQTSALSTVD